MIIILVFSPDGLAALSEKQVYEKREKSVLSVKRPQFNDDDDTSLHELHTCFILCNPHHHLMK